MKKLYVIFVLFSLIFIKVYSQNFLISFAGSGASTSINSVIVTNLMQNSTVTLNSGDVLNLGVVGINELNLYDNRLQIYPNPMQGQTELSFYAQQTGNTQLIISDISGKELYKISCKLVQGIHKYKIAGLSQGVSFINIIGDSYFYTSKLINLNSSQNDINITYLGHEGSTSIISKLKSTNSTVNMSYNTGDYLLFKGISGNYSTIVTDIPTSSKTINFNFVSCTDCENNNYATVQIGTQLWMAENLKTTKYRNCNTIPNLTGNTAWSYDTIGAYCDYNNIPDSSSIYGRLYNWFAVVDSRNLCPIGWHVPIDSEWTTLTIYLGGENIAGGKLKETGLSHWLSPNTSATNETGFTALPAGGRESGGAYGYIGSIGYWWSSTEFVTSLAWFREMFSSDSNVGRYEFNKQEGFSVRCLRN